jgi:hypothetical protein
MRWAGRVAFTGKMRNAYRILIGKPDYSKRPRRVWEDSVKMYLKEIVLGGVDWIHAAQDRSVWWAVVNAVMALFVA